MKEVRIFVDIHADGRIEAQAEGFTGDTCLQELDKLLGDLGEQETVRRTDQAAVSAAETGARSQAQVRKS
jgi:DUF2997 family protein